MFFKPAKAADKHFGTRPAAAQAVASAKSAPVYGVNINTELKDLIIAITAMHDVLTKENEALDHASTSAFLALQDEKVAVARNYERVMSNLLDRADELKTADSKLKAQILFLEDGFSKVMKDNMAKIERMKGATEKLGEFIMSSARKSAESRTQFAYGASGSMQRGNKATIGVSEQA